MAKAAHRLHTGSMLGPVLDGEWSEPKLASAVEGWWSTTVAGGGTVIPDGAVDVMWASGQVPWLAGPDTEPRDVTLAVGTNLVGVRLRVGAGQALVSDGLDRVANQRVSLDAVWSTSAIDQLGDRLAATDGAAEAAACLAAAIAAHLPTGWQPDPLVVQAQADLAADGAVDTWGLSERQFRRRFVAAVGFGPAFFRRLSRLDRFLEVAQRPGDRTLAELGCEAGYFDQSHLGRDCVTLTGLTPGQLSGR